MPSARLISRQLSATGGWKSTSEKWENGSTSSSSRSANWNGASGGIGACWKQMSFYGGGQNENENGVNKKRVMVVIDENTRSKHAMMWALTHVANNGDCLTLLHIISSHHSPSSSPTLARSLASLSKACNPQVEVEAVVIQGPKLATVLSQVKKLEVSVLVLGQKKPSPIMTCLFGSSNTEEFVEKCINIAECLTIGVRKQSKSMGGYLISTRWQKNFWLLA